MILLGFSFVSLVPVNCSKGNWENTIQLFLLLKPSSYYNFISIFETEWDHESTKSFLSRFLRRFLPNMFLLLLVYKIKIVSRKLWGNSALDSLGHLPPESFSFYPRKDS